MYTNYNLRLESLAVIIEEETLNAVAVTTRTNAAILLGLLNAEKAGAYFLYDSDSGDLEFFQNLISEALALPPVINLSIDYETAMEALTKLTKSE